MNRLPQEVECIWYESRPRVDFKLTGSSRGIVSFRGEDTSELLRQIVTGYANLLAQSERLKAENKTLRAAVDGLRVLNETEEK